MEKKLEQLKKRFFEGSLQIKKNHLVILAGVGLIALGYIFRSQFIVAVVNGQPISRFAFTRELEKQAGQNILDTLVTKTLILQAAEKEKIKVSDEEIEEEIKQIEQNFLQQGQDLDVILGASNMDRSTLKEDIRIQKMVEKLLSPGIEINDEEINQYLEQVEGSFPAEMSPEEMRISAEEQLRQQKISEASQTWISSLHDEADIKYFLLKPQIEEN